MFMIGRDHALNEWVVSQAVTRHALLVDSFDLYNI